MSTTPPTVLQLARQGNPEAIAALMNRHLEAQGITAHVEQHDTTLKVSLEAAQVPNQTDLVAYVQKGITGLELTTVQQLTISGKQVGATTSAWSENVVMQTPDPLGLDFDLDLGDDLSPALDSSTELGDAAQADFDTALGGDALDLDLNLEAPAEFGAEFDLGLGDMPSDLDLNLDDPNAPDNLGSDLDFDLGLSADPAAELDLGLGNSLDLTSEATDLDFDLDLDDRTASPLEGDLTFDLDFDAPTGPEIPDSDALDFDDLGLEEATAEALNFDLDLGESSAEAALDTPATDVLDFDLDLDIPNAEAAPNALEFDLDLDVPSAEAPPDFNLDFDTDPAPESGELDLGLSTEAAMDSLDLGLGDDGGFDLDLSPMADPAGLVEEEGLDPDLGFADAADGFSFDLVESNSNEAEVVGDSAPAADLDLSPADNPTADLDLEFVALDDALGEGSAIADPSSITTDPDNLDIGFTGDLDDDLDLDLGSAPDSLDTDLWDGASDDSGLGEGLGNIDDLWEGDEAPADLSAAQGNLGDEPWPPADMDTGDLDFDLGSETADSETADAEFPVINNTEFPDLGPSADTLEFDLEAEFGTPGDTGPGTFDSEAFTSEPFDSEAVPPAAFSPEAFDPNAMDLDNLAPEDLAFEDLGATAAFDLTQGSDFDATWATDTDQTLDDFDDGFDADQTLDDFDGSLDTAAWPDPSEMDNLGLSNTPGPWETDANDLITDDVGPADLNTPDFGTGAFGGDDLGPGDLSDDLNLENTTDEFDPNLVFDSGMSTPNPFTVESGAAEEETQLIEPLELGSEASGASPWGSEATDDRPTLGTDIGPDDLGSDRPFEGMGRFEDEDLEGTLNLDPDQELISAPAPETFDAAAFESGAFDATPFDDDLGASPFGPGDLNDQDFGTSSMDNNLFNTDANSSNGFLHDQPGSGLVDDEPDATDDFIQEFRTDPSTHVSLTPDQFNADGSVRRSRHRGVPVGLLLGLGLGALALIVAGLLLNGLLGRLRQPAPGSDPVVVEPVTPAPETPAPEAASPETPSPEAPVAPTAVDEADRFRQAVNAAQTAANQTQTATTAAQWQEVANTWATAIDLMERVPPTDPNYATAQQKAVEYQPNLNYAQQNAERLQ
jgi:pilus assembly protein FimV